jgi:predicted nucleic acid-binding protein
LVVTEWLIDKSALVRLAQSVDAPEWASRIERGLVRISSLTRLQVGFSARSGDELRASSSLAPLVRIPTEYVTPAMEDRAVEVQQILADRGLYRAPPYSMCYSPPPQS